MIVSDGCCADPASEGSEPGKGLAALGSQQVFGHPVNGEPVADFGRGDLLGGQQRPLTVLGFIPLMIGAGYIDPVPALPPSGGGRCRRGFFACSLAIPLSNDGRHTICSAPFHWPPGFLTLTFTPQVTRSGRPYNRTSRQRLTFS